MQLAGLYIHGNIMCREERVYYILALFAWDNFVKILEVSTIANDENQIKGKIRAKELRLIGKDGEQIGDKSKSEALEMAERVGLDVVLMAPNAKPPVARIMDYGKYRFEQQKKEKEMKKKQKTINLKEIRLSPTI